MLTTAGENHRNTLKSGFSLVEIMIAMSLLGIVALGLGKAMIQSRKMAESSIYATTAHGVAYGYAEQIMALDYVDFESSVKDNAVPVTLKAISPSSTSGSVEIDDPLYIGVWTDKDIVIDVKGEGTEERSIVMPMKFSLSATSLNSGVNPRDAYEIKLAYQFKSPSRRDDSWLSDTINFVKSSVPIY
ncbi:prepilin-type N-terminal cleavage/methylation domain-containing protein [Rubellicoccus peritrichatus]|uniref:Prepilin-type N-terminal cleavage/methylation domain-containing protein n=1 Tax=Rubellicoccus peritrichatus TaxID=3080537 RepID=A0AAQ3L9R1_9BACT|nr:prepilin-type N-terminal cleavage/methylation domain-containing protein [Puniceicoccus sp. CR14]WOO39940.1 prepilin-type N-terminal cleavage/methylation domain-containing protein [Puniceicoccus sp. CR14]